ncbi:MAG TPA: winged helix-turn-helix domain-containing protein [Pyrinomonadaceae bacterium]|nr:winged helix-turn-helix domain-containing protein [Pyrinomonadaceae bacterium]
MEREKSLYHFGPFSLDAGERVLLREGRLVPLPAKAVSTLLVLVRMSGHVVEKDVLMNEIWPAEDVEEGNLAQHVFMLRKALGENGSGRKYIETVPRRGYRFLEAVRVNDGASPINEIPPTVPRDRPAVSQAVIKPLSLAVLPFFDASGNPKTGKVSDSITERIINDLSQVPHWRVMSRSAVSRYKGSEQDAQRVGTELRVDAVLLGTVSAVDRRLLISAELVDVANGWQLWGDTFDCDAAAVLAVQDEIASAVSGSLRSRLFGDERQRVTQRFTENTEAYQAYLRGRRAWSRHTREGIQQAIVHFQSAIEIDPGYALAYAAIIDSNLRLATNYLPPENVLPQAASDIAAGNAAGIQASLEVRYEWDLKAMERELKRSGEPKPDYPATHQWHAAYLFSREFYHQTVPAVGKRQAESTSSSNNGETSGLTKSVQSQFHSASLTPAEEVQIFCVVAREQMLAGNYEAANSVLERWWTFGDWPRLDGLTPLSSADLLFTAGAVARCIAGARQITKGQKHAEALLNGSIALYEQLGLRKRTAEGRIELGFSYFREGLFDLARRTLLGVLGNIPDDLALKSLALMMLGLIERSAGRLHESLTRLTEAAETTSYFGPWATAFCNQELALTLKDLAAAEGRKKYLDQALKIQQTALHELEAIGHHRCVAAAENNYGALLLALGRLEEAEARIVRARLLYDALSDNVRRAQADDTLARLHIAAARFGPAQHAIEQAVESLETCGQESLFAEALTTQGVVLCKVGRFREAKRVLDRACQVAERCGDSEGAGGALLIVIEEMGARLEDDERLEMGTRLNQLLSRSQKASTLERLKKCQELIATAHASHQAQLDQRLEARPDSVVS